MKTRFVWFAVLGIAAATAGCGGGVKCGDGTFKKGDDCVGYDPDDDIAPVTTVDPPGGRTRDPLPSAITLTANEPARIYWTTDGSDPEDASPELSPVTIPDVTEGMQLRFFAKDLAGNEEEERAIVFSYDPFPPAPPVLTWALTGSDAELNWTNPGDADFAGTLVARVVGSLDAYPVPGQLYTAPAVLSSNVTIVASGTGSTSFSDANLDPGFARYVAWSYDDLGNYSPTAAVYGDVSLGTLTGTVSVDVAGNVVTPTAQPTHLVLSGTSSYLAGTLTLNLSVQNLTTKYFQNPKFAVVSSSVGTFSNSHGTIDGLGVRYIGPDSLGPGDTSNGTLTFTGVGATDTVVVTVRLLSHPFLLGGSRAQNDTRLFFTDSALGSPHGTSSLPLAFEGPNGGRGAARSACATPDGRYAFVGNQHFGAVERIDLSTRSLAGSRRESVAPWASSVICNGHGDLYVVLDGGGRHSNNGVSGTVGTRDKYVVIRLDEELEEMGRLVISGRTKQRGMGYGALSADGTRLAFAAGSEILLVDTTTMTQILPSDATLVHGFTDGGGAIHTAWSGDKETLFLASYRMGQFGRMDFLQGDSVTPQLESHETGNTSYSAGIAIGSDGRVWTGSSSGLFVYDPATRLLTQTNFPDGVRGVLFLNDELYVLRESRTTISVVDADGDPVRSFSTGNAFYQHWIAATGR